MAKRVVYRENDNIDYEERAKYAAMSREELDKLLKEDDVMILRQLEEAAAPLPEKPEMKVRCVNYTDHIYLKNGKVYSAYHSVTGLFRVTDDSGETFLYSPEDFEIVEEY